MGANFSPILRTVKLGLSWVEIPQVRNQWFAAVNNVIGAINNEQFNRFKRSEAGPGTEHMMDGWHCLFLPAVTASRRSRIPESQGIQPWRKFYTRSQHLCLTGLGEVSRLSSGLDPLRFRDPTPKKVLYAKSAPMSDRSWQGVKTFFGVGSPA